MKKIFGFVFLLTFICQIGRGEPFFEIGTFTNIKDPTTKGGVFLDVLNSPHTMEKALEIYPEYTNGKRLFYVSTDGSAVVGEALPEDVPFQPKAGDLIVTGNLFVRGEIMVPNIPSSTGVEKKKMGVAELRREVDALKKEIELLKRAIQ